jgi:prepilin-type N-terminal cleavage/methylation domain-containing protein
MLPDYLQSGYRMKTKLFFASCMAVNGSRYFSRRGFTLFEVSISLVLVAFGVVSVLMLFPSGLKAQQMARFQIYAAAKAEEMIEQFNGTQHSNPAIDTEGMAMWDVPVAHKAQSWDLESRLSSHRYGIMPLPLDIAKRLDSDGDEIQGILDEGGYVYFSQPMASTGTQEQGAAVCAGTLSRTA